MSALLALLGCAPTSAPELTETHIVAIGPAVAQTALALAPDTVVGVDTASTELGTAEGLPHVGHARQVSAEGVLSLAPTRVLVTDSAGPADVLAQIEAAGIEVIRVPHERSVDGVRTLIREVAGVVDAEGRLATVDDFELLAFGLGTCKGAQALADAVQ